MSFLRLLPCSGVSQACPPSAVSEKKPCGSGHCGDASVSSSSFRGFRLRSCGGRRLLSEFLLCSRSHEDPGVSLQAAGWWLWPQRMPSWGSPAGLGQTRGQHFRAGRSVVLRVRVGRAPPWGIPSCGGLSTSGGGSCLPATSSASSIKPFLPGENGG